jgi:8-oxo-dGTP pyrophosphatase MutT (NUDIX family)
VRGADDDLSFGEALRATVARNLASFERAPWDDDASLRRAAVAVTIAGDERGDACFVITRRAATLKRHAGQWALPGGRLDEGETAADAALRELFEEVGVAATADAVLGLLDDYPTRSGYLITPAVVWGPAAPSFTTDPSEVTSVHLVPLAALEAEGVPRFIPGTDPERPVIQIPLYERYVHAPTAAVLYQLREVGLHGRDTRVAHYDQPTFAWQ